MERASAPTIYDVASHAGVSIATVSRYLNSPAKVNVLTADKIRRAMEDLAYVPLGNSGPQSMRKLGRIGVLTPFFTAPSFVDRMKGIASVLKRENFELVVFSVETKRQLEDTLHSLPSSKRIDGVLVLSLRLPRADSLRFVHAQLPVVTIEIPDEFHSRVLCDNFEAGAIAARFFLENRYWPCAYLGETEHESFLFQPSVHRLEGFRSVWRDAGYELPDRDVRLTDGSLESAQAAACELLDRSDRPRAIFAMSDLQAMSVLHAARRRGLNVPLDVAVLGFDDIEVASYLDLTTISQSLVESGKVAAELLISRIREGERPIQEVKLAPRLVKRSTA